MPVRSPGASFNFKVGMRLSPKDPPDVEGVESATSAGRTKRFNFVARLNKARSVTGRLRDEAADTPPPAPKTFLWVNVSTLRHDSRDEWPAFIAPWWGEVGERAVSTTPSAPWQREM